MFRCTLRASLHFAILYGTVHYFSTVHTQPLDPLWLMEWSQRFSFSSWNFNFFLIAPPEVASFDKSRRCSWNVFYSPLNATAPTFFLLSFSSLRFVASISQILQIQMQQRSIQVFLRQSICCATLQQFSFHDPFSFLFRRLISGTKATRLQKTRVTTRDNRLPRLVSPT